MSGKTIILKIELIYIVIRRLFNNATIVLIEIFQSLVIFQSDLF